MPSENPILNNPYQEPRLHYATNDRGELDYSKIVEGRRPFVPIVQTIPLPQGAQGSLLSIKEADPEYGTRMVNLVRKEVAVWREAKYPNTTRITRELLNFWFLNEERADDQKLFFAQQEALETAIWLNEVAPTSNAGTNILRRLSDYQKVSSNDIDNLSRIGFKMATGTGKTVVMAALLVYHFFNRREYRQDTRFADNFLIVAPGITIRDRLGVLRVDPRTGIETEDYYYARYLTPRTWRRELLEINSRLVIVNFHAFEPKTLQGNKRGAFDGKLDPTTGKKRDETEDWSQVVRRVLGSFKSGTRLLVFNDEAHHCYLPRQDNRVAEGEETEEENKRAAVWFTGLREISARFKLAGIYDLSATPYFLTGSGYEPYTLFPWVVSDFGLIEAIESGLVKIPYLPTKDDTSSVDLPVLRNLYEHVRADLPRAGRKTARRRAKEEGTELREEPPHLPDLIKAALQQFYDHYKEEYDRRAHSLHTTGTVQLEIDDTPPVFIIVCNNTSVSKEVFKYIAGYKLTDENDVSDVVPGALDLFSNFDPASGKTRTKPPTLLIDSDALENSGQIDTDFKRVFAPEIENFKRDYARIHGRGAAEDITEAEILREIVNTVGKRNALGSHIRCVVSVSMLTEGWDANTVTHIMGIRAFGSQLLCEQVAGRALRRKRYFLQGYDKEGNPTSDKRRIVTTKFPPEYAHIIGVPFKLFKGGSIDPVDPPSYTRIFALHEREAHEITFPAVEGYRLDYPEGPIKADFSGVDDYLIDGTDLPTETILSTAVSGQKQTLTVNSILERREQEIFYAIAKRLLRDHFSENQSAPEFYKFHRLKEIVGEWYETKVRVLGKSPEWKKLLFFRDPAAVVAHIARGIHPDLSRDELIRPVLNYYNPIGSTRHVHGNTSKDVYPTRHSHVNLVVVDSGWEAKAAKILDDLVDQGSVLTWVKNAFLGFRIPYVDEKGKERDYMPDFIVRLKKEDGSVQNLIVEVSGTRFDKEAKLWTIRHRWLPAVNAVADKHEWDRWDFLELDSEAAVKDLANLILPFTISKLGLVHA
ncbi:MAG TPA: DEAD/DEAH box helicase family protein [Candidatus Methylacidiphilales bacterium]|jgi:type III restriction enzyme|nr:DEAD/DEAH box helicase family protein [Candidatus Methylacidiphilales bacterium]